MTALIHAINLHNFSPELWEAVNIRRLDGADT